MLKLNQTLHSRVIIVLYVIFKQKLEKAFNGLE